MTATAVDTGTAVRTSVHTAESTIARILEECVADQVDCTEALATRTYAWVQDMVMEARYNNGVAFPGEEEMQDEIYMIFDHIAPHGEHSKPGSAHEGLEATLLDRTNHEAFLIHDQLEIGGRHYCTVQVGINIVRY
jgi:hypothetical protein